MILGWEVVWGSERTWWCEYEFAAESWGAIFPSRRTGRRTGRMGVMIHLLSRRRGRVFRTFSFFINCFPCSFISAFSSSPLGREFLQLTKSINTFHERVSTPAEPKNTRLYYVVVHRSVAKLTFILYLFSCNSVPSSTPLICSTPPHRTSLCTVGLGTSTQRLLSANKIVGSQKKIK